MRTTEPRGWHSRGYLPHFDAGEVPVSITYRLASALPLKLLRQWQEELKHMSPDTRDTEERKRIEGYVDRHPGDAWLSSASIAAIVEDGFLFFDGARYRLHAWVIMPNHVHVLLTPLAGHALSDIVHSWKSYSSTEANRVLGRTGRFWHPDYFDRTIRDQRHFEVARQYIERNPLNAGLCDSVLKWPFGSGRWRDATAL